MLPQHWSECAETEMQRKRHRYPNRESLYLQKEWYGVGVLVCLYLHSCSVGVWLGPAGAVSPWPQYAPSSVTLFHHTPSSLTHTDTGLIKFQTFYLLKVHSF